MYPTKPDPQTRPTPQDETIIPIPRHRWHHPVLQQCADPEEVHRPGTSGGLALLLELAMLLGVLALAGLLLARLWHHIW